MADCFRLAKDLGCVACSAGVVTNWHLAVNESSERSHATSVICKLPCEPHRQLCVAVFATAENKLRRHEEFAAEQYGWSSSSRALTFEEHSCKLLNRMMCKESCTNCNLAEAQSSLQGTLLILYCANNTLHLVHKPSIILLYSDSAMTTTRECSSKICFSSGLGARCSLPSSPPMYPIAVSCCHLVTSDTCIHEHTHAVTSLCIACIVLRQHKVLARIRWCESWSML